MKRSLWGFLLDAILWSVAYFVLSFLALATLAAIFMVRPNSPLETYAVIIFSIPVFAGWMFVLALALSTLLGIPAVRWMTTRIDLRPTHWVFGGAAFGLGCSAVALNRLNMDFAPEVGGGLRAAFWLTFLAIGLVSGVVSAWLLFRLRYHREEPLASPW
jgi:hypothetical protein